MASITFTRNADYNASNSVNVGLTRGYTGTGTAYTFDVLNRPFDPDDPFNGVFELSNNPQAAYFFYDAQRQVNFRFNNSSVRVDFSDNTAAVKLSGGNFGDVLLGGSANDTLSGAGGNDTLSGGTGTDKLLGGAGNDTYVTNGGDTVTEAVNAGTDTVMSSASFTLSDNVENLVLTGTATNIYGKGNAGANRITGNAFDNVLDGAGGSDTLMGGSGNDNYYIDGGDTITEAADGGTDTVRSSATYTLGANLENLVLTGTGAIDGTGNALANRITGNSGNNRLDGGTGADTLIGGLGDDTYVTDGGDTISEAADAGTDTVESSLAYTLGANLERLVLTGTGAIAGTGNALENRITGNSGNNRLDGGIGADTLIGGAGDDTYVVDQGGDSVVESAGQGTDTVETGIDYALGANLENLRATEGHRNILRLVGNAGDNLMVGASGTEIFTGGAGKDTIDGGDGSDTASYADRALAVVLTLAESGGTGVMVGGIAEDTLRNVENIEGSTKDDRLTGNAGRNALYGGDGNDTLFGGNGGTDLLDGGNGSDTLDFSRAAGAVTAAIAYAGGDDPYPAFSIAGIGGGQSVGIENVTGSSFGDTITGDGNANTLDGGNGRDTLDGGGGNDRLVGGLGADDMTGGAGDDVYLVDDAGDATHEAGDGGQDTVYASGDFSLGAGEAVEALRVGSTANGLALTGNDLQNLIVGGAGGDTLDGAGADDRLFGLDGRDTLKGGEGNDRLDGGAGDDVVTGGVGLDQSFGGTGTDRFVFERLSDSMADSTRDAINDFSQTDSDVIDLSALDAKAGTVADDGFSFIGAGAFTKQTGQLHYKAAGTNTLIVEGDVNGDAKADFQITVRDMSSLTAEDFVL